MKNPLISIAIPVYDMPNKEFFLNRCLKSVREQSYQNFEIVITEKGKMAENTNEAIKASKGDIIKILYMDDYFAHKNALQSIVDAFRGGWLATGCSHDDGIGVYNEHLPTFHKNIHTANTIGSPSVLTIENKDPLMFDETMTWMLDCDYYKRLYERYGPPTLLDDINVVIGVGDHQTTAMLSDQLKANEHKYMLRKHDTST